VCFPASLSSFFPLDFVFSSISAANIHRIKRANVKWAGDDGHHSEESTHDIGEALEGSGCNFLLSLSFSHFLFSSIGAANIHRIAWANVKRAGDSGTNYRATARGAFDESFCSLLHQFL
jgi:hypothetical protein